jgi:hypothetical protein
MAELSQSQKTALKVFINANPTYKNLADTGDNDGLAKLLSADATTNPWCWRTAVTRSEYEELTSQDATTFDFTVLIARSQGERDVYFRLFDKGPVNPSRDRIRQAFADIFSGASGAAQRTHMTSVSRRKANVAEKALATGTGTTASPMTLTYEGGIDPYQVTAIMADG